MQKSSLALAVVLSICAMLNGCKYNRQVAREVNQIEVLQSAETVGSAGSLVQQVVDGRATISKATSFAIANDSTVDAHARALGAILAFSKVEFPFSLGKALQHNAEILCDLEFAEQAGDPTEFSHVPHMWLIAKKKALDDAKAKLWFELDGRGVASIEELVGRFNQGEHKVLDNVFVGRMVVSFRNEPFPGVVTCGNIDFFERKRLDGLRDER